MTAQCNSTPKQLVAVNNIPSNSWSGSGRVNSRAVFHLNLNHCCWQRGKSDTRT
ncbi:hypothetical protein JOB18_005000 [Solea senegalensis]|uniref:Uncharacterized protein n=1 Tax=Solea senegalensis TaxID=28829 RepID=A0AAV6PNK6_SOLSE|nr:hypothetical protein JOB18_005000 [Solea senegalensis]